jgi:hypothetical protein
MNWEYNLLEGRTLCIVPQFYGAFFAVAKRQVMVM